MTVDEMKSKIESIADLIDQLIESDAKPTSPTALRLGRAADELRYAASRVTFDSFREQAK